VIPKRAHTLLSEIHGLLAAFEVEDFLSAAQFSPELKDALNLLAQKAGRANKPKAATARSASPSEKPRAVARSFASPSKPKAKPRRIVEQKYSTKDEIRALLNRIERLDTPQSIIRLSNSLGLNVTMNPKDGSERLMRRMASAIATLSKERRAQVIAELVKNTGSQTLGWINVLKGRG
jgi:hypothetical protein